MSEPEAENDQNWMILYEYICVKCGAHYLSNEEHTCAQKSRPARKPTTSPVTKTVASSVSSPSSRRTVSPPVITPVITPAAGNHAPRNHVITPVITPAAGNHAPRNHVITPVITATQKEAARQARWREKNREAYNARMRAWRARQKAPE